MPSVSLPVALGATAVVGAGASLAGASMQSNAIQSAAQQQAAAAQQAQASQMAMFNQVQQNISPFMQGGQTALQQLQGLTGTGAGGNPLTAPLTTPFQPTMEQLEQTPGYQFSLGQGLKATQNSYAAQGLGASGAAMKGAANYAEGLAGTTYQQQFQNFQQGFQNNLTQNAQIANILQNQVNMGANSAAGLSSAGIQSQGMANQALMSGAAASAAGTVGQANALAGGLTGATSSLGSGATNYALLNMMQNNGMFGGGGNTAYSGMNQTGLPGNAILGG